MLTGTWKVPVRLSCFCVCSTDSVTVFAESLYAEVTVNSGYPAPYTHWSKNQ